jgi:UbiD family decarboxylase
MKSFSNEGLRGFISLLEQEKEILRVDDEVDWKYGIGDYIRNFRSSKQCVPAFLFENIKNYPGHRVLTNALGNSSRMNLALGLNVTTPYQTLISEVRNRFQNPIEAINANEAPGENVILSGADVDLEILPAPWWNRQDVGRYIGTWHVNITKDPYTGIRNLGVYRMQLISRNRTYVSVSPNSHLGRHLGMAEKEGKPLEMAVAIGVDETLVMAGAAAVPYGIDEFSIAGGLSQSPVVLRKCREVDLEVPTKAEIVIEGRILPGLRGREGPFLDYAGIPKANPNAPVFEVTHLEYRKTPIFRGALVGEPGAEDHLLYALIASAGCLDFHGSKARQFIQNLFLRVGYFRIFQHLGVLGQKARDMYGKAKGS